MGAADRVDQLPLARPRTAADVVALSDLVQLLTVAILEPMTGLAAALPATRGLFAELAAGIARQMRDRTLASCGALRLPNVASRRTPLLGAGHLHHLRIGRIH